MGCVASTPTHNVVDAQPTTKPTSSRASNSLPSLKRTFRHRHHLRNSSNLTSNTTNKVMSTPSPPTTTTSVPETPPTLKSKSVTQQQQQPSSSSSSSASSSSMTTTTIVTTTTKVNTLLRPAPLPPILSTTSTSTSTSLSMTSSPPPQSQSQSQSQSELYSLTSSSTTPNDEDVKGEKIKNKLYDDKNETTSVRSRIARFNQMEDTSTTMMKSSSISSSITSSSQNSSGLLDSNESSPNHSNKVTVAMMKKNSIHQRIIEFERQAVETELLKSTIHKPNPNRQFKHDDISSHRLERPRVFSSPAIST